jgi:two-component system LytT family response regulator
MPLDRILIPKQDRIHVVKYSSILFFQSDNCYAHVHLADGRKLLLIKSLAKIEKEIQNQGFIRISQSFLVNSNFISSIHKKDKLIYLEPSHNLPFTISIKKLAELMTNR